MSRRDEFAIAIAACQREALRLRRHLQLKIRLAAPRGMTIKRIAMHEAAHCVVLLSHGLPIFFVHMGEVIGGRRILLPGSGGVVFGAGVLDAAGEFAVAGMVQDRANWIGTGDGRLLMAYLTQFPSIGPWPSRHPALTKKTIAWLKRNARAILRREAAAVRAVADLLLTPGRIHFEGSEVEAVARGASTTLPPLSEVGTCAAACWTDAMAGDLDAHNSFDDAGTGILVRAALRERRKKSQARRPNPKPVACPASRP